VERGKYRSNIGNKIRMVTQVKYRVETQIKQLYKDNGKVGR
jgi:hypothetical protein